MMFLFFLRMDIPEVKYTELGVLPDLALGWIPLVL